MTVPLKAQRTLGDAGCWLRMVGCLGANRSGPVVQGWSQRDRLVDAFGCDPMRAFNKLETCGNLKAMMASQNNLLHYQTTFQLMSQLPSNKSCSPPQDPSHAILLVFLHNGMGMELTTPPSSFVYKIMPNSTTSCPDTATGTATATATESKRPKQKWPRNPY